jgi:predicted dithiol-disulfide oxidoreductase (DUF899 family)
MNPQIKNPVVTREQWNAARAEFLVKEKAHTRAGDALAKERMALPWVLVDKDYQFEGPTGTVSLSDLFDGRSQLIVYHFMYGPDWDAGCPGCSFLADHMDGTILHLNNHDVTLVAVSRAPLATLEAYKERMGWNFPWYSSFGSDFNYDYGVSFHQADLDSGPVYYNFKEQPLKSGEQPGTSVFYKTEGGEIYHTYSSYERGGEPFITTYNYLDIAPLGRNEEGSMGNWMQRHDEY